MNIRPLRNTLTFLSLLVLLPPATRAADVLQNVPSDALGFVVVKNLAATDAKIGKLLKDLRVGFPAPIVFLASATGLSEGLDLEGDVLFAVLPGDDEENPQFGVWLPLRDYDRFLTSLEARERDGIVAVIVAGEDILVARHGGWVLVMDPDQRQRMEQLLATNANPPAAIAEWRQWINANNVAVVVLPGGISAVVSSAATSNRARDGEFGEEENDIFGQAAANQDPFVELTADGESADGAMAPLQAAVRDWIARSPKLADAISKAQAVGCTLRLDDDGNALVGARLNFQDKRPHTMPSNTTPELPPALYQGGKFLVNGAGAVPRDLTDVAAEVFVRAAVDDLKTEQRLKLDDAVVARFQHALEDALAGVGSAAVLTQPGEKAEGIYTNDFLVVRVPSADDFIERADEVMRLWNTLNREAEGESPLIFDVEEQKIGSRAAKRYSLDIAGAEGLAIPEVRQAMEKFFGPEGKMTLWIVRVDDHNVLLATATQGEVAAALEVLDRKQAIHWDHSELAVAQKLQTRDADWRLFFSPSAYAEWHRRLREAMTGPVVGGRPRKDFPVSPPIGIAGGSRDSELWIDAAVPTESLKAAGAFLK